MLCLVAAPGKGVRPMDNTELLKMLVCPWCLGELKATDAQLHCVKCSAHYSIESGIPDMLVRDAALFCPLCKAPLEKQGELAVCRTCGRRFDMSRRVEKDLLSHAQLFC